MDAKSLYISLLKKCLLNTIYCSDVTNADTRQLGVDWPRIAHTMVGAYRLDNLHHCVETALKEGIEGDFIETGVWRGGCVILIRGILKAHGVEDRKVWAADSFEGLPKPNVEKYPQDRGYDHTPFKELSVGLDTVKGNFSAYNLLDDQVVFLKGWFKDTLPHAPIEKLAVLRLDGDLYESTMDALNALYDKVSMGGFIIVDDYGALPPCKVAIGEFRERRKITSPLMPIDNCGVYWRKVAE